MFKFIAVNKEWNILNFEAAEFYIDFVKPMWRQQDVMFKHEKKAIMLLI